MPMAPRGEADRASVWDERDTDLKNKLDQQIQESEWRTLYLEHFLRTGSPFYGKPEKPFFKGHVIAFRGDHREAMREVSRSLPKTTASVRLKSGPSENLNLTKEKVSVTKANTSPAKPVSTRSKSYFEK